MYTYGLSFYMSQTSNNISNMRIVYLAVLAVVSSSLATAKITYTETSFGAEGDGNTDSTKSFLSAWSSACNSTKSATIYVPTGTQLIASAITFAGERCLSSSITIRIYGTLVAPSNYNSIANSGDWIRFHRVNHVTISGGILDEKGASLWSCKTTSGQSCPKGATVILSYQNYIYTIYTLSIEIYMLYIEILYDQFNCIYLCSHWEYTIQRTL